jgi:hypothetical protein
LLRLLTAAFGTQETCRAMPTNVSRLGWIRLNEDNAFWALHDPNWSLRWPLAGVGMERELL